MKKFPFPIWNIIAIFVFTLFMLGFYLDGKLSISYTWSEDWGLVTSTIFAFCFLCLKAGIEHVKITQYLTITKEMKSDKNHDLYEYLRSYLVKYKDSEKPRIDVFKNTLLIRMVHLNTSRPIDVITNELSKNFSQLDKDRMIELNMLIDHWIEEFLRSENNKINEIFFGNKPKPANVKKIEYVCIDDAVHFSTISYLLTNVCHENVNNQSNIVENL